MDVLKKVWDGDCQLYFEMKEGYKVSCVKNWCLTKLLKGWFLFEILHTSSYVKTSKNVVKSALF